MSGHVVAAVVAVLVLAFMFELLRRRRLREKYAGLWICVALVVLVSVMFPGLLERLAGALGVTVPLNLVLFSGLALLLLVCVQLSAEVSGLEDESQTLAEELALLRNRLERVERSLGQEASTPPVADPDR